MNQFAANKPAYDPDAFYVVSSRGYLLRSAFSKRDNPAPAQSTAISGSIGM